MTAFTETSSFDSVVNELATTDAVQGGVGGAANAPFQPIVNRTRWLYNQVQAILSAIGLLAPIASPTFTGTPTAPNPNVGDATQKIATMAALVAAKGTVSVAVSGNANLTLTAAQYGAGTINLSGALTAAINVIFPTLTGFWIVANGTNQKITAKTAAGSGVTIGPGASRIVWGDGTNLYPLTPYVPPTGVYSLCAVTTLGDASSQSLTNGSPTSVLTGSFTGNGGILIANATIGVGGGSSTCNLTANFYIVQGGVSTLIDAANITVPPYSTTTFALPADTTGITGAAQVRIDLIPNIAGVGKISAFVAITEYFNPS